MKVKYRILEECNGCGACKVVCPMHCISKGKPFVIHQDKCNGCGKCIKRCRKKLICIQLSGSKN